MMQWNWVSLLDDVHIACICLQYSLGTDTLLPRSPLSIAFPLAFLLPLHTGFVVSVCACVCMCVRGLLSLRGDGRRDAVSLQTVLLIRLPLFAGAFILPTNTHGFTQIHTSGPLRSFLSYYFQLSCTSVIFSLELTGLSILSIPV